MIGWCPFRVSLKYNAAGESFYVARSWMPQKVLCAIQTFLGLLRDIQEFLNSIPEHTDRRNPVKYFLFMSGILDSLMKYLIVKKIWLNQTDFLNVLNFMLNGRGVPSGKAHRSQPIYAGFIVFFSTGMGAVNWLFSSITFTSSAADIDLTCWSIKGWWYQMSYLGWEMFFIDGGRKTVTTEDLQNLEFSGMDTFMGILGAIGYFHL